MTKIALLIFILNFNIQASIGECISKTNSYFSNENEFLVISNFNKFQDLFLECKEVYNIYSFAFFMPNKPILIDQSLKWEKIFDKKSFKSLNNLFMNNFKGFDMNAKPIGFQNTLIVNRYLLYAFSSLDFYINNTLIQKSDCKIELFDSNEKKIFYSFTWISFIYTKYQEEICPFVFQNSFLDQIYFTDITNSFLSRNLLNFVDVDFNKTDAPGVIIRKVILQLNYASLTTQILNKYLFRIINKIKLYGVVNKIQSGLFLNFYYLKYMDLQIDNFRELFHKGNIWMKDLNFLAKNFVQKNEIRNNLQYVFKIRFKYKLNVSFINQVYEYPDEDFCLFRHFPHDNLVLPVIVPGKKIRCSCTLLWLIQDYKYYFRVNYKDNYDPFENYFYYDIEEKNRIYTIQYCHNEMFENNLLKCNFTNRLENCDTSNFSVKNDNYEFEFNLDNDTDLVFIVKWLQFILIIILQPILSLFCILFNLLTIKIIHLKHLKKSFSSIMYKHIVINSYFNIIYCVIINFGLINQCIFINSIFCSSVYYTEWAQYFKIIVSVYSLSVNKFCKNVSFLVFSISRFATSLDKKNLFPYQSLHDELYYLRDYSLSATLTTYRTDIITETLRVVQFFNISSGLQFCVAYFQQNQPDKLKLAMLNTNLDTISSSMVHFVEFSQFKLVSLNNSIILCLIMRPGLDEMSKLQKLSPQLMKLNEIEVCFEISSMCSLKSNLYCLSRSLNANRQVYVYDENLVQLMSVGQSDDVARPYFLSRSFTNMKVCGRYYAFFDNGQVVLVNRLNGVAEKRLDIGSDEFQLIDGDSEDTSVLKYDKLNSSLVKYEFNLGGLDLIIASTMELGDCNDENLFFLASLDML